MNSTAIEKSSDALGLWAPRRTLTLAAARRHSKIVRFFRFILLLFAALVLAALVWEFITQPSFKPAEATATESVRMTNPRYSGRTEDNLPFYLTAKEALRLTSNTDIVELIDPVLHFYREQDFDESVIVSKFGTFDDVNKILNLNTSVDLKTDDGNHCITNHARIFVRTNIIEGDKPISCKGGLGIIDGKAYEIKDNYSTFIFKKGVNIVLDQSN